MTARKRPSLIAEDHGRHAALEGEAKALFTLRECVGDRTLGCRDRSGVRGRRVRRLWMVGVTYLDDTPRVAAPRQSRQGEVGRSLRSIAPQEVELDILDRGGCVNVLTTSTAKLDVMISFTRRDEHLEFPSNEFF